MNPEDLAVGIAIGVMASAALCALRGALRDKPPLDPWYCPTCGCQISKGIIYAPEGERTYAVAYCSSGCAEAMPWCEACQGYHHLTAPGCFKRRRPCE